MLARLKKLFVPCLLVFLFTQSVYLQVQLDSAGRAYSTLTEVVLQHEKFISYLNQRLSKIENYQRIDYR